MRKRLWNKGGRPFGEHEENGNKRYDQCLGVEEMANDRVIFRLKDFFVLFCVGAATIWLLTPERGHPAYTSAVHDARSAQDRVTFRWKMCQYFGVDVTDEEFNLWLAHRLPTEQGDSLALFDPPPFDIWKNPHQIRRRTTPRDPPLVYSLGEDGMTSTNGMDADDIRGWQERPGSWYANRESWRRAILGLVVLIVGSLFVAIAYMALGYLENVTISSSDKLSET